MYVYNVHVCMALCSKLLFMYIYTCIYKDDHLCVFTQVSGAPSGFSLVSYIHIYTYIYIYIYIGVWSAVGVQSCVIYVCVSVCVCVCVCVCKDGLFP
jgi:hypothetical protein